jgi:putative ABC transport system ATP-binding protein
MHDPMVAVEHVSRSYDDGRVTALQDVTLAISPGEYVAIVGPSGSGKSTLLHLLCGLDRPTQGRVCFEGIEPASRRQWAKLRATRIGFVFQAFYLLPTLSAQENVEVPMFGVLPRAKDRQRRALELLERVGLTNRARHRPFELSGGERQRVAIARSLANAPALLLADEPTGNLDSKTAADIMQLLHDVHRQDKERKTLVLVTHNLEITARSDRLVHIVDGRIVSA